ncbi:MAG TPA: LysR family transcriptional regulator [Sphingobium sp.]
MADFKSLSYFVAVCECGDLGSGASHLGVASSTLSASLKSLEAGFGVSLFRKQGGRLAPRRFAHWLYQAAVPLLLLEKAAFRRATATADEPFRRLRLDIRLPFTLGHFNLALSKAMADAMHDDGLTLIDPVWSLEMSATVGTLTVDCLAFDEQASLTVESVPRAPDPTTGEILLCEDRWMMVRRRSGLSELSEPATSPSLGVAQAVLIPAFPPALLDRISPYAKAQRVNIQPLDAPPSDWPQLLDESPAGTAILLPESALWAGPGRSRIEATPLDPPLTCSIVARTDGSTAAARFVKRLNLALADTRPRSVLDPALTGRRIRYFNLAYELGRVSAAARAASVAQPALSQQLQKLETSLGTVLFDRHTFGLARTAAGRRFAPLADLLERRLRELHVSGATASLADGARLSLGVLPSVSHHGHLISRITDAILALHVDHPAVSVTVREAPNSTLQNAVLHGGLGLAIVETALTQMPRFPLDVSEELVVVADARHGLLPPGPIRLADLTHVPLALPSNLYGLRQLLDQAAHSVGIVLRPRREIDALAMLVALLSRERVATVLPASAVRPEILRRELIAHPIIEPSISRRLYVIYSGDRSLTPIERHLVTLLRSHLNAEAAPPLKPLHLLASRAPGEAVLAAL